MNTSEPEHPSKSGTTGSQRFELGVEVQGGMATMDKKQACVKQEKKVALQKKAVGISFC